MTAHGEQGASQPVDLSKYALQILAEQDRPLFDDAVKAAEVGALPGLLHDDMAGMCGILEAQVS